MAGEKIGKAYEALLKVALDDLRRRKVFSGSVFWNKKPAEISVEPDFILGASLENPNTVFMVTHSGSSGDSHKKTWRNIGELCEVKTTFNPSPSALNVVFDASMKEGMKALQAACFDCMLVVEDRPYGTTLLNWVKTHSNSLPKDQDDKADSIAQALRGDPTLKRAMKRLEADIELAIHTTRSDLRKLWDMERARPHGAAPEARNTYVRRGFTKRILIGTAITGAKVNNQDADWLIRLGLAKQTLGGCALCDEELLWFMGTTASANYQQLSGICSTAGFKKQVAKVRSFSLLNLYEQYVLDRLEELSTFPGMRKCIMELHDNPCSGLTMPSGVEPPSNVWIYDFVASLVRARTKKGQAFGYSAFSAHPDGRKSKVGTMSLGYWCNRFACEYLNRKPNFQMPSTAIDLVAKVLAEELQSFSADEIRTLHDGMITKYLAKEFESVLLAHRGFDPLLAMLLHGKVLSSKKEKQSIRTCFAEKAGTSRQTGCTTVAKVQNTLINWQTATDSGKDHKRKELCGRAVGLRYTWDAEAKQFKKRSGVEKLVLLLDGTWTQKDLDTLVRAGWDEIYYPDEIDKLKASVLGGTAHPAEHEEEEADFAEAAEKTKPYGRKRIAKP